MSKNSTKNLFYNLYSTSNDIVAAGYTCNSAVDEKDTSFDIMSTSKGSEGAITDSNGDRLSTIDLTNVHAGALTQYTSETKILQPYSCCLLQGEEYGLARATYYYKLPYSVSNVQNYENYLNCYLEIVCNNFSPQQININVTSDTENSITDLLNDEFSNANIDVSVSIQQIYDKNNKYTNEYLVFLSQKEGYFFYIKNIKISPVFASDEYPLSPFSKALSGLKSIIYNFITQFHPVKIGEEYVAENYEVYCNLYTWLIVNYQQCIDNLTSFKQSLDLLSSITAETGEEDVGRILEQVNRLIKYTPYDMDIINEYDVPNMYIIYNIIDSIRALIQETSDYYQDLYWLNEDRDKRVPLMKYPNGAFRGIVIIPDWPTNSNNTEYESLWINHISDTVTLYKPVEDGHYVPKTYGVMANAVLTYEKEELSSDTTIGHVTTNCDYCNSISSGWGDIVDNNMAVACNCDCCVDINNSMHNIYEDTVYMGQNCYAHKKDVIGIFRYMQYVNDNNLWNKIGQLYITIGNNDDEQSLIKNLPRSVLIYNPNPEPIRIKYMIFS